MVAVTMMAEEDEMVMCGGRRQQLTHSIGERASAPPLIVLKTNPIVRRLLSMFEPFFFLNIEGDKQTKRADKINWKI